MTDRANTSAAKQGLPCHPLANIFPLIEGQEFDDLVADVGQNGLRDKITVVVTRTKDGAGQETRELSIVDGRNRYRACVQAGLFKAKSTYGAHFEAKAKSTYGAHEANRLKEPYSKYFAVLPDNVEIVAYVVSKNLLRRHLDESQRSVVAAKLANMRQGERTDREPSANLRKVSQVDAARMLSVSERTVTDAAKVLKKATPEIVQAVEIGKLKVSQAAAAADLNPADQVEVANAAMRGDKKGATGKIKNGAKQATAAKARMKIEPPQSPLNADEITAIENLKQAVSALAALYAKHVTHKNGTNSVAGFLIDVVPLENVRAAAQFLCEIEFELADRKRAADNAKRLVWEAKNPKRAYGNALAKAIELAMESDMEEARQDAKDGGEPWGETRDDWIEQWKAENWLAAEQAEFDAYFREAWKRGHGTDYPEPPAPKTSEFVAVEPGAVETGTLAVTEAAEEPALAAATVADDLPDLPDVLRRSPPARVLRECPDAVDRMFAMVYRRQAKLN
jgi:hypothetical protein